MSDNYACVACKHPWHKEECKEPVNWLRRLFGQKLCGCVYWDGVPQ